MRNSIDHMIDLAKVFSSEIRLTKDVSSLYLVSIDRVYIKEGGLLVGNSGRGETVELACDHYMNEVKGKLLVGDDPSFYGEKRPEYLCV